MIDMRLPRSVFVLLIFTCILFPVTEAFSQVDQHAIEASFEPLNLTHPYLLFDKSGKAEMLDAIEKDQVMREVYEAQILEAFRSLKMPLDIEIPNGGDESRYFSNNTMRRFMERNFSAALNLAFAYQLTGKEAYADKAYLHAELLCRLESWVYPFHEFPQIYDRVWPWNVGDDQVVFSYDLQSARIASHLALVYDWIYEVMDKGQRDRIRGALLEKAITRVRGNFEYHWWSTAYRCNWSGICYSGAGLASLAILTENPELSDVVSASYNGVSRMLDELGPDGGWQEGRGYWSYGISHSIPFMDAVKRLSSDKLNLFHHPNLKDNPADYPLFSLSSNFGDGRDGPVGYSWFLNKLVAETDNSTAAWYNDQFLSNSLSPYDLIWPRPDVEAVEPPVKSKYFRGIDCAILRSNFNKDETFTLACKAGLNDDPHHGHLDCGHFTLSCLGRKIILDPGRASYDDFYFSAERWDYVEASSLGHNVIFVNGETQISAKLKDQPWKEEVGGHINDFHTSSTMDYVSMNDLEKAYPGNEMLSWQRQIILEKPSLLIVFDRVGSEKGAEIKSRLHPVGKLNLMEGYYTIENEDLNVVVIPFSDQEFQIEKGRQGSLTVNDNADLDWIQYVDVKSNSESEITHMGYLIFSSPLDVNTKGLVSSIQLKKGAKDALELSFTLNGKAHTYPFSMKDGSLQLDINK